MSTGNTGNSGGGDSGSKQRRFWQRRGGQRVTQFACTTVASQQFDPDYMRAYSEPDGVMR